MGDSNGTAAFLIHRNGKVVSLARDNKFYNPSPIVDVLLAENALRELVQREEMLQYRVKALQKTTALESNKTELEKACQQLDLVQAQHPQKEHALYRAEYMLMEALKKPYDEIKREAAWFMREEMIQDCSDRGGCCSRGCECCEQRSLAQRKKGRGHCTTECRCCISCRGFELPDEEKDNRRTDLESMLNNEWNANYLLKMANSFFCSPKPQVPPTKAMCWWQYVLGRG